MKAKLLDSEIETLKIQNETQNYASGFAFLNSHKGLRNGKIHSVLGRKGAGKTTFLKSICTDFLCKNKESKIYLHLSEELEHDYILGLSRNLKDELNRVEINSEQSNNKLRDPNKVLDNIYTSAKEYNADLVVIDNITTSRLYMDLPIKAQSDISVRLKGLAIHLDRPVILAMHTKKEISENHPTLIDDSDVRGCDSIGNIAEFFYVLQWIRIEETIFPTMRITKHRGQRCTHRMFTLNYSDMGDCYFSDREINFKEFKERFSKRNRP